MQIIRQGKEKNSHVPLGYGLLFTQGRKFRLYNRETKKKCQFLVFQTRLFVGRIFQCVENSRLVLVQKFLPL